MEKAFWQGIVASEMAVPEGDTPAALLPELLAGLGATDPELRDQLCLEILSTWIWQRRYSADQVRAITGRALENLTAGVGERESDRIFLRSFSALLLAVIVQHDARERFLSGEELRHILAASLRYLLAEQDLRGYVPEKGWAHSVAHTADLLTALADHPLMEEGELEQILAAVGQKLMAPTTYPLVENEDGRLARMMLHLLKRDRLPPARLAAWAQEFGGAEPRYRRFVTGRDHALYHNLRSFLQALYLVLAHPEVPEATRSQVQPAVYAALKSFSPWL